MATSPHPNPLPCQAIRGDFDAGCSLLLSDTRWRWITKHLSEAEKRGHNQKAVVAATLVMDKSYFSRLVARQHGRRGGIKHATHEDYRKVLFALDRLEVPVEELPEIGRLYRPHDPAREARTFQVAGSLVALNRLGAELTECRPLGPLHYFCLERMSAMKRVADTEETWAEAEAADDPQRLQRAAENIHRRAEVDVDGLDPHVLEDFINAHERNPLPPRWHAFRTLYRVWRAHWVLVRDCMRDPEPAARAARTNRN